MRKCTVRPLRARYQTKTDKYAKRGDLLGMWADSVPGYALELENGRPVHAYRDASGAWWIVAPECGQAIAGGHKTRARAIDAANMRAGALERLEQTPKWAAYVRAYREAVDGLGYVEAARYQAIMEGK